MAITIDKCVEIEKELKRFTEKLQKAKKKLKENSMAYFGCRETGALKRASMDLSNELVKLRK